MNVSAQDELPLAGTVELDINLNAIAEFFSAVANETEEDAAIEVASRRLLEAPDLFSSVRQFLGISDKRAYLDLSYLASRTPHPTADTSLCGCLPWTLSKHPTEFFESLLAGSRGGGVKITTARLIARYLLTHGVFASASSFAGMTPAVMGMVYTRLIAPKEYQQKAAKRRGHGCEAALARVLTGLGVDLVPADKAINPMGTRDPNLDPRTMTVVDRKAGETFSFDLLVIQGKDVRVAVQSLIHTSDPGQYGVNKSDETVTIARDFAAWRSANQNGHVELWGLLDGVGFSENKPQTINKLLRHFDEFIQLRTLYKAGLRLHQLGLTHVEAIRFSKFYNSEMLSSIRQRYVPEDVRVLNDEDPTGSSAALPAGEATLYIPGRR